MSEKNHKPTGDEVDRVLDAALAKYAGVEPRTGLEERILANLRAEQTQVADRAWWRWSLAAAAVAVVVAAALAWRSGRPSQPMIANRPAVTTQDPPKSGTQVASHHRNAVRPRGHGPIRRTSAHPSHPTVVVAASPKLDQFPSPQPLSEQEKMLLDYVERFPNEVAMIAQAQTALKQREALLDKNGLQPGQAEPQIQEKVE